MKSKKFLGSVLGLVAALTLAIGTPLDAAAQQTGTVTGTVINAMTGDPISGAQVMIVGTALSVSTGENGNFRIINVPAGTQQVQARFLGFAPSTQEVEIPVDGEASVDFQLVQEAIGLDAIVVTATGEQVRKRELGNVVGDIRPVESDITAVTNLSNLIQGRSAGVMVSGAGGSVGTGSRIRIRGAASVSLSNDPLIIIDGVRADNTSESSTIGVGGQSFSRFEDINPQDIENIEILKGPAATAMYGTAAGAGVIQITTRRGVSGEPRWSAYVQQGIAEDIHDYPDNYNAWFTDEEGEPATGCTIAFQATGDCQVDSLAVFNPVEEVDLFRTGHRQTYGMNVSGGGDQFTYYLSGELQDDQGVVENNHLERINLRGNFNSSITEDFDVEVRTGYSTSTGSLPQNDNNTLGLVSGALLGRAVDDEGSRGWFAGIHPDDLMQIETAQQVDRLILGSSANWRPVEWLDFRATVGMDNVERHDNSFTPPNTIAFGTLPTGERTSNRIAVESYTGRLTGRTTYQLTSDIEANTALGGEFTRELFEATLASGTGLLPGTRSLAAASDDFSVSESFTDIRTVAGWLEQRFAWQDRVYLNASLRADDDSALGDQLDLIWYPAASLSWVMDEEEWFPQNDILNAFRLRGSFGRAGLRPGFRDALLFFDPETVNVDGANEPGFSLGGAGNPDLRPEISTEYEFGFDSDLFGDRVALELTYFNKTSRDALVQRRLSPSLGATTTRWENVGEVVNQGIEFGINSVLVSQSDFTLSAGLTGSFLDNELTELGGVDPIIFGLGGDTQRHQEGYPLGGYWGRRIVDVSPPAEGPVTRDDFTLSEEQEFIGSSLPTREISLSLDGRFFDRIGVRALFDHQGGHYLNNSTRFFRCGTAVNCRELYDSSADPRAQAEALAALDDARATFIEPADYIRFRELAVDFTAPSRWAEAAGAGALRLTLTGRNLATWTDYSGLDPEINFAGQSNFSTAEFLTQPPLRYFTARVSVDF